MVIQAFQKIFLVLLLVLLVFNLTQRRHLAHGERKRIASLVFAGLVLLHYAVTILILHFSLPAYLLLIPAAVAAFVLIRFKDALFLFSLHCAKCEAPLPISVTLYHDDNLCPDCRTPPETAEEDAQKPGDVKEIDWDLWKPDQKAALCLIVRDRQVLLIRKKTGLGAGKINMPGGRIEQGETAADAVIRECQEEVGITPYNPEQRADLAFEFTDGLSLHCSAFYAFSHSGELIETDEADPFWCDIDKIPFREMWEDDALWIPRTLEGELVKGVFIFDGDRMVSKEIRKVEAFD